MISDNVGNLFFNIYAQKMTGRTLENVDSDNISIVDLHGFSSL